MITDKHHAALTAAQLATSLVADSDQSVFMIEAIFQDGNCDELVFDLVQRYKFTGESMYLHHCGLGQFGDEPFAWKDTPDAFRLALTLYCANVPILTAFIPPEVKEDPKPAPDPRRGFESINHDSDNTGTIYERENLGQAQARLGAAIQQSLDDAVTFGTGAVKVTQDGVDHVPVEDITLTTDAEDVTENTDVATDLPAHPAEPDSDDPHSGGDVIEDDDPATPFDEEADDDDSDGEVIGDDPPATLPAKSKKKRR